jgi:D-methionine transport system substrate-binding protein
MNNFKKILNLSALISGLTLLGGWAVIATTACSDKEKTITIVATENPHTKILNFAEKLFNDDGWKLKIETVDGYYTANPSVSNGSADANYFQHKPFLDNYNDGQPDEDKLVDIVDVHLEPLGAYSQASAYHNN